MYDLVRFTFTKMNPEIIYNGKYSDNAEYAWVWGIQFEIISQTHKSDSRLLEESSK